MMKQKRLGEFAVQMMEGRRSHTYHNNKHINLPASQGYSSHIHADTCDHTY